MQLAVRALGFTRQPLNVMQIVGVVMFASDVPRTGQQIVNKSLLSGHTSSRSALRVQLAA